MSKTKIEWCNKSWNVITGCSLISTGCIHCYARRMANRLRGRYGYPADEPFRVTFHPDRLNEPLHWKKPCRIFVCSMGDLFHEEVDIWQQEHIFDVVCKCKHHIFILLTKRIENAIEYFINLDMKMDNVWMGVTAETQDNADKRIPELLKLRSYFPVLFLSVEPCLGPVILPSDYLALGKQAFCVVGGETGPGARLMNLQWARDLRDQCVAAKVPFFFKKMGSAHHLPKEHQRLLGGRLWEEMPR